MSLTHAFLGLLEGGPGHGYELKRRLDARFPASKPVPYGQVYATLARLARSRLIDVAGVEAGEGPERKRYVITPAGVAELERWLREPAPVPDLGRGELFSRVVVALLTGRSAGELLEAQRTEHLRRMRQVTDRRRDEDLIAALASDLEIAHLEADIRWIERAEARVSRAFQAPKTPERRS
jgi:DNA-binding PadR family transcriptional regulator